MRPFLLLALSPEGILWGAPDDQPTHVFFVLGLRYDALHLKVLSQLARMTRKNLVPSLLDGKDEEGVVEVMNQIEKECPRK